MVTSKKLRDLENRLNSLMETASNLRSSIKAAKRKNDTALESTLRTLQDNNTTAINQVRSEMRAEVTRLKGN
jgi:hypothetical protein